MEQIKVVKIVFIYFIGKTRQKTFKCGYANTNYSKNQ